MPKHKRHLPARPLVRLLELTVALAVLAAVTISLPSHHPPQHVATVERMMPVLADESTPTTLYEPVPLPTLPPVTFPPPSSTPRPRPAPAPSGDALTAIAAHFGDVYDQAVAVARCESSLDPGAVGGNNYGLFQISIVHKADFEQFTGQTWTEAILNADSNAAYARKLYDGMGWAPWSCAWAAG